MDFTDRRFDEADATGQRMSFTVHHLIRVARDNQKALEEMLSSLERGPLPLGTSFDQRSRTVSTWFGFWSLTMHGSGSDGRYGVAWQEQRQHGERLKLIVKIGRVEDSPSVLDAEAHHREVNRRYLDEAHALGMAQKSLTAKPNLTIEIPKLCSLEVEDTPDVPNYHLLNWRWLSGIQHGDMGAVLNMSDKKYQLPLPGGMTAQVSVNDQSLVNACYSAAAMQLAAMNLYIGDAPQPPSLSETMTPLDIAEATRIAGLET